MSDYVIHGRELPAHELIRGHHAPQRRAVWCDDSGHILFHTDQRVTVPDAGNLHGVIVGFDQDERQIGVLFDNGRRPIYFDVDMIEAVGDA